MSDPTDPTPTTTTPRNFAKTFIGVAWLYGGRAFGLLWTLVLVHKLGVGNYGLYGMSTAVATIVGPSLDNAFQVRAIRESEERFVAERTGRFLLGLTLIALGLAIVPTVYFAGFGLTVAGGEIALNVLKSRPVRDGHPNRSYRMDTARQSTSVVAASGYLWVAHAPTLLTASLMYCTPYVVIVILGGLTVRRFRPAVPGPPRLIAALCGEMLGTTVYLQGDVLVLGWLTNSTIVGYYSLTWIVAAAVIAVGQSFAMTYHEPLRESGGAVSAGPPLRNTLALAGSGGALVLLIGLVLLVSPVASQLAVAMMIMSGFVTLRTVSWIFQVILYNQRRDLFRFTVSVGLIPVKFGLLAALAFLGAIGAAISSTLADAVLLVIFATALYRTKTR